MELIFQDAQDADFQQMCSYAEKRLALSKLCEVLLSYAAMLPTVMQCLYTAGTQNRKARPGIRIG
ncbi:hypothetical protein CLAFUW4_07298 [Fulvia fulva]|uniref:Uncharacterized protein n=1 Tax=Passalora fulva TaxID=5499 RepID=A0A9Q8PA53_PASFU|nr:uncharacterized protein CLAFUR5_07428 [Fulvia fulva]KAK4622064.1 hypothetical protein CLAFUR4_07306 [Fulvia fulva]KAK4623389.1 hypothetical protein CLAFUR0_07304 [Fulvia fulva]UJO18697.1 hypothetical protein CLAFUR5_07428 [Fulvia fulva]WPV16544.1 hypothetical protein CLAFUW4_07298 [Fulvia fulva]WPV31712.1 hypothetical protein CLAFUW7_07300 [Fulvia fulva]